MPTAAKHDPDAGREPAFAAPKNACDAHFHVFGEARQNRAPFGADGGGDDHAVRFDSAKFARREIGDDGNFSADERIRFIELRDAGADLADFGADVYREFQQLVSADDSFSGFDLAHAHFDFREVFNADFLAG